MKPTAKMTALAFLILAAIGSFACLLSPRSGMSAATTFATPLDNVTVALTQAYTPASGVVQLPTGYGATLAGKISAMGFPAVSASAPLRFTLTTASKSRTSVFLATAISGDQLTGVTVETGSTDQAFASGDTFSVNTTARALYALQTAVNAIEAGTTGTNATSIQGYAVTSVTGGVNIGSAGTSFVGINTPVPAWRLHVTDTGTPAGFQTSQSSSHSVVQFYSAGLAVGSDARFAFNANDSGGVSRGMAGIGMHLDSNTAGAFGASLYFRTSLNGLLPIKAAVLDGSGNWWPNATANTQALGLTTNRWNANLHNINIDGSITGSLTGAAVLDSGGAVFNVKSSTYGAFGDSKFVADGAMSSTVNPTQLTSATAAFVAGDVGKTIAVVGAGAGGATISSTINSVTNATTVVLGSTCQTTVNNAAVMYGHDDTSAINAAITAASTAGGGIVRVPPGNYLVSSPIALASNVRLEGVGTGSAIWPTLSGTSFNGRGILEANGVSSPVTNFYVSDLILDSKGTYRLSANAVGYQVMLGYSERGTVARVDFRDHGYGGPATALNNSSDPALLLCAKDDIHDLANTVGGTSLFPAPNVGACQGHQIYRNTFGGTASCQFAIRLLTDWTNRRLNNAAYPTGFTNHCENNLIDGNEFTGTFGWNVIELAGGGTRFNTVSNNWLETTNGVVFATLTAWDLDKGCNYNDVIANRIEAMQKPSYYLNDGVTTVAAIDDHGLPATDATGAGGAYYSEGNRIIANQIGTIDTAGTTDTFEAAIRLDAVSRSLVHSNTVNSVNPSAANGNGIVLRECSECLIAHNHIKGVKIGIRSDLSATSRYKLAIGPLNSIESTDQCIVLNGGTAASGNLSKGVKIDGNPLASASTTLPAIYLGPEVTAPMVTNNAIIGGKDAVECNTSGATLSGNDCEGQATSAFRLYFNAVVEGNRNGTAANDIIFSGTAAAGTTEIRVGTNYFTTTRSKTTTYTMVPADEEIFASASGGAWTLTLTDPRILRGQIRAVIRTDNTPANAITFATPAGTSINNNATLTAQFARAVFKSDGSNWWKVQFVLPFGVLPLRRRFRMAA